MKTSLKEQFLQVLEKKAGEKMNTKQVEKVENKEEKKPVRKRRKKVVLDDDDD